MTLKILSFFGAFIILCNNFFSIWIVDFCLFTPEAHRIFAEKTAELVHQLLD